MCVSVQVKEEGWLAQHILVRDEATGEVPVSIPSSTLRCPVLESHQLGDPVKQVSADHARVAASVAVAASMPNQAATERSQLVSEPLICSGVRILSEGRTWWPRSGELLGAVPLYLKSHSYGEYVFDNSWASTYHRTGQSYYPKLQARRQTQHAMTFVRGFSNSSLHRCSPCTVHTAYAHTPPV